MDWHFTWLWRYSSADFVIANVCCLCYFLGLPFYWDIWSSLWWGSYLQDECWHLDGSCHCKQIYRKISWDTATYRWVCKLMKCIWYCVPPPLIEKHEGACPPCPTGIDVHGVGYILLFRRLVIPKCRHLTLILTLNPNPNLGFQNNEPYALFEITNFGNNKPSK